MEETHQNQTQMKGTKVKVNKEHLKKIVKVREKEFKDKKLIKKTEQ